MAFWMEPELSGDITHPPHDTNQSNVKRHPNPAVRPSLRSRGQRKCRSDARLDQRPEKLRCDCPMVLPDSPAYLQSGAVRGWDIRNLEDYEEME
jgi:hypothetical protein